MPDVLQTLTDVPPPPVRRRGWVAPAVRSAVVVVVALAVYVLVPHLSGVFGDVGGEAPLQFSSTTVIVGPSDTGTVTVTGAPPAGGTATCVRVRFTGHGRGTVSFGAEVAAVAGSEGRTVVRVDEGTDAGSGDQGCARFEPSRRVFDGTVKELAGVHASPWTPSGPQVRTYRVSVSRGGSAAEAVSVLLRWQAATPKG